MIELSLNTASNHVLANRVYTRERDRTDIPYKK